MGMKIKDNELVDDARILKAKMINPTIMKWPTVLTKDLTKSKSILQIDKQEYIFIYIYI